ncbi:alpha-glucuronidase family glycosyl hydrolase [Streptomyces sp. DASNCL29]|uniref:alpha-glucuronidase family glycosyl hydrolase n=1 Tax=Streptomyces sp. DASNCL29 TaxID=2583819 RepID=UPI00110F95A0|nr:alpha-glucuronidase family glycosyl hydrolase [Streptomyces sp. DASNCL29]TMU96619.1 glycoside hydrolase [Streptomyces sp. DASNCL29]
MARSEYEYEYSRRRVLQASALALATVLSPWSAAAGFAASAGIPDEDGYDLWLRYRPTADPRRLEEYRKALAGLARQGEGRVMENAELELRRAVEGFTGTAPARAPAGRASVVIGTVDKSPVVRSQVSPDRLARIGAQGFVIEMTGTPGRRRRLVIGAHSDRGVLAGVFHLIRLLQLERPLHKLSVLQRPRIARRMMNHWDNFDGSIERGYAGTSIFEWDKLPDISDRVVDYARSMASIGINASVLNNVNASADFITSETLTRLRPLAALLHSWGISTWLSVNYASPMILTAADADPITTADPADRRVQRWWRDKSAEIFTSLPGFGGFLVKANSEGQPGPLDYGRTHAEGANMLARTVAPHDGQIVWRSFVHEDFGDWAEYQYRVFAPLDGAFDDNVILQTKYGPIDFQIREPVHPLFGALRHTNQMLELQLTQEYTGHEVHTTYLAPLWREVLTFPTQGPGTGPTVADILADGDGRAPRAGIAGVSNFGNARDWTGQLLGAANTYAFGRMCWNPDADPRDLAAEWAGLTFGHDPTVTGVVADILTHSRRTYEDYTSPLGMGYLTDPGGDHLDPSPLGTLFQSHHSTTEGTGFDRTEATGSGFTGLYPRSWRKRYESTATCPDDLLLFMHWVPYDHRLRSGKTVIQHIYDTHFTGVDHIDRFRARWSELSGKVDRRRHAAIEAGFEAQRSHATFWRDMVVGFFFDRSRVVDAEREWLQVALNGPRVLLGGRPNLLPVAVTNASARDRDITVALRPPSTGWHSEPAEQSAAGAATAELELPVTPPLPGTVATLDLEVAPQLTRLDGRPPALVVAPDGGRCLLALNAGPRNGTSMPGYDALTPESAWSASAGHGWVGAAPSARDRGGEPLLRDHLWHNSSRVLRLALPAGKHTGYALVGDTGATASPTRVAVDGATVATSPKQPSGTFTWLELPLDGGTTGRTTDITFTGVGGPWRLSAFAVTDPTAPAPSLVVLKAAAEPVWWTGRANPVTVLVRNTGAKDRAVTARLVTPDGWSGTERTVTVAAGAERELTVTATPVSTPGFATVEIRLTSGDEEIERGRSVSVVTTPHPDDVASAFDAGPPAGPLLTGYTRLSPEDGYTDDRGFGWVGDRPLTRDRGNADDLRRDIVMQKGEPIVLRVPVPAGKHTVWVLTGDSLTDSGVTTISEGGTVLGRSGDDSLPSRAFVWFSFDLDGGADGRTADLEITGSKLNGLWRIAALVVG